MDDLKIQIGTNTRLAAAADELRCKVFIEEQGIPKEEVIDGLNPESIHVVIFDGNIPIATARVTMIDDNHYQIRLVAVDRSRRGCRLGERVMRATMDYISTVNVSDVFLTAQQPVVGFYEKLGFEQCGAAEYLESGFVLVPMKYVIANPVEIGLSASTYPA